MTGTSFLSRLHRTSGRELADFVEALGALAAASAAIRLLPFRTVMRTASFGRAAQDRAPADRIRLVFEVKRAVKRASARLPWRIVCFPEGLAVHWMLRRRGAPSQVHYGLRQSDSRFSAHVWVTLDGAVVVGEETTDRHTCVAVFPPASS
jgi:hypothetical protein